MTTEIIYGDCREVLPTLKTHTFDLCLTDPPYRVTNWETGFGVNGLVYGTEPPRFDEWLWEVKRVLKPNGQLVLFEHPHNLPELLDAIRKYGFDYRITGMWHASNRHGHFVGPFYRSHVDVWVWAVKGRPYTFNYLNREEMCELFDMSTVRNVDLRVPGIKPLEMVERFVKVHTNPGDWVLDPFLGSGTTLKACKRTDRNGVGIDIRRELSDLHDAVVLNGVKPLETWTR